MAGLNQEFWDMPPVPSGIAGDYELVNPEEQARERLKARAFMEAERAALIARVNDGTASPDEEARLIAEYASSVAHGYN